MTITDFIRRLIKQWAKDPREINCGDCEDFAGEIENAGFGTAFWGDELNSENWSENVRHLGYEWEAQFHCFIEFNGQYYDSECPEGVNWPDELPFFQRNLASLFSKSA